MAPIKFVRKFIVNFFDAGLSDQVRNVIEEIIEIVGPFGIFQPGITDQNRRQRAERIDALHPRHHGNAADFIEQVVDPGDFRRIQIFADRQRQTGTQVDMPLQLFPGQGIRPAQHGGQPLRGRHDGLPGIDPRLAHLFQIKTDIVSRNVVGEDFQIGSQNPAPQRRNANAADRLAGNFLAVQLPVADLLLIKPADQHRKQNQHQQADDQNSDLRPVEILPHRQRSRRSLRIPLSR